MDELRTRYLGAIAGAADEAALEELRVAALGKRGEVSLRMRELGGMTPEERQVSGPALNALKDEINGAITAKKAALEDAKAKIIAGEISVHDYMSDDSCPVETM